MNKFFCLLIILFPLFVLSSCLKKKLNADEYVTWVQDYSNGLHKKKQLADYTFDVQYQPLDYVLLKNQEETEGPVAHDSLLSGMHYFTLKITDGKEDFLKKGADQAEHMKRLYYYSYGFQGAIHLREGEEELPCELYHFERSYDMTATRTFVLGFPRNSSKGIEDLVLELDCQERGLGLVKVKIDKSALEDLPELR